MSGYKLEVEVCFLKINGQKLQRETSPKVFENQSSDKKLQFLLDFELIRTYHL